MTPPSQPCLPFGVDLASLPPSLRQVVSLARYSTVKAHPDFWKAKNGDEAAAARLWRAFEPRFCAAAIAAGCKHIIPLGRSASQQNAIPYVVAAALAERLKIPIAGFEKKGGSEKIKSQPITERHSARLAFAVEAPPDGDGACLIVDDILGSGKTVLTAIRDLRAAGWNPKQVFTLCHGATNRIVPRASTIREVLEKFGLADRAAFKLRFNYEIDQLTENHLARLNRGSVSKGTSALRRVLAKDRAGKKSAGKKSAPPGEVRAPGGRLGFCGQAGLALLLAFLTVAGGVKVGKRAPP